MKITNKKQYKKTNAQMLKIKSMKTRWSLLPWEELDEVGKVFTDGAIKYKDDGWKFCDTAMYKDAIVRHLMAFLRGEDKDTDSGYSHLSHVIANALILLWKDKHGNKR